MATGEVQLIGTIIGTSGAYSGFGDSTTLFDGDFTTSFTAPDASGDWAGIDLGSGNHAVVTRWRYAPTSGDSTDALRDVWIRGAVCQAAADATFAGAQLLDTIPGTPTGPVVVPFAPRYQYTERPLSPGAAYRAYRYYPPDGGYCQVAELRWIADAATLVGPGRPVAPTISPWGGKFPSGSATVSFASLTTSASFYYTVDGSTPTTGSTLYTGPFTLTIGAGAVTLKVIAYDASLSTTTSEVARSAIFYPWGLKPAEDWYDDRGILLESHAGCTVYDPGTARYYRYGFSANRAQFNSGNDIAEYMGVFCQSSTDLLNWRDEGHILDTAGHNAVYRCHVRYNASTSKWVLIANVRTSGVSRMAIATSSSPNTGWTWSVTGAAPNGYDFSDFAFFADYDGTGYLVVDITDQGNLKIFRLNSDWLSVDATDVTIHVSDTDFRESPVLFRYPYQAGGTLFLVHSKGNYYDSTLTYDPRYQYTTASTPLSGWSSASGAPLIFASDPVGTAYNAQPTDVLILPDGTMLYMSDRWSATELYASRYVWLPATATTATSFRVTTPAAWTPPLTPLSSALAALSGRRLRQFRNRTLIRM